MRTARLKTVRAWVATTRCCCSGGSSVHLSYCVTYPVMHLMLPTLPILPKTEWQTDTCKYITFSQLRLRVVTRVWTSVSNVTDLTCVRWRKAPNVTGNVASPKVAFRKLFDSERLRSAWVHFLFPLTHFLPIFRLNTWGKHKCSQNIAPWLWSGTRAHWWTVPRGNKTTNKYIWLNHGIRVQNI